MSSRCDLDDLALELCPYESLEPSDTGWKCANACGGCKKDAVAVLSALASKARIAGYPAAAEWMDSVRSTVKP